MARTKFLGAALLCLAACGDPLEGVDRIGDMELSQTDPVAAALPSEAEVKREGFFGTQAASGVPVVLSEETIPVDAASDEKPRQRRGILGLFLKPPAAAQDTATVQTDEVIAPEDAAETALKDAQVDAVIVETETPGPATVEEPIVEIAAEKPTPEPKRWALFRRSKPAATADEPIAETVASPSENMESHQTDEDPVVLAALAPETPAVKKRRGLFGGGSSQAKKDKLRTGPDAREVDYGAVVPFGEIVRSCKSKGKPLGRRIEKASARGFALYDTRLGSEGARTFYITGFNDGCPRQLTAANVLLGSASMYEQLHYGPFGRHLKAAETDRAYEKVKRRICGARSGRPCGAKIKQMEKSTFFVSAYASFGGSKGWSEMLIHDGEVLAAAMKSN